MKEVKVNEAKTNLSKLLDDLSSGREREIVIFKGHIPVAKLTPYASSNSAFGAYAGLEYAEDAFTSSLVEEDFSEYL